MNFASTIKPCEWVIGRWPAAAMVGSFALLAACGTPPGADAPASAASAPTVASIASRQQPPSSAPASRPSLAAEQRRLAALFRGTPVVFTMQTDGDLRVDVPIKFCFEPGKFAVRPPLAAVIDKIALSQHDGDSRIAIGAPADPRAKPRKSALAASGAAADALDVRRAASVRDRLVAQGIAFSRIRVVESGGSGVKMVVRDSPAP